MGASKRNDGKTPLIDDRYWFEYSKALIDSSVERRDQAAAALQKLVTWLWGIYTASAAVGFGLVEYDLGFQSTFLVAVASGLLIIVYWGTVWVQMPTIVGFDPRSPTEIETAHAQIIRSKNRRLVFTLVMSVLAAVMVSVTLVVASVDKSKKSAAPDFQAVLSQDKDERVLALTAWVGEAPIVQVDVTPFANSGEALEVSRLRLIPVEGRLIQTSVHLDARTASALVKLVWKQKSGIEVGLSGLVKVKRLEAREQLSQ
jgi:hypothetical protein